MRKAILFSLILGAIFIASLSLASACYGYYCDDYYYKYSVEKHTPYGYYEKTVEKDNWGSETYIKKVDYDRYYQYPYYRYSGYPSYGYYSYNYPSYGYSYNPASNYWRYGSGMRYYW